MKTICKRPTSYYKDFKADDNFSKNTKKMLENILKEFIDKFREEQSFTFFYEGNFTLKDKEKLNTVLDESETNLSFGLNFINFVRGYMYARGLEKPKNSTSYAYRRYFYLLSDYPVLILIGKLNFTVVKNNLNLIRNFVIDNEDFFKRKVSVVNNFDKQTYDISDFNLEDEGIDDIESIFEGSTILEG